MNLDQTSPKAPQPPSKIPLVPCQLAMLHRCKQIEKQGSVGIIGDLPGSGKSFVVLSMVLLDPESTNILVVPQNIHTQWAKAISSFCNIRWSSYINYNEVSSIYFDKRSLYKNQLVLTTPLYFDIIVAALDDRKVSRVFIDEIDSVDFMIRNKPNAFLWLVSASFDKKSLTKLGINLDAAGITQITCRCNEAFVRASFPLPEPETTTIVCKNVYIDHILHGMVTDQEYAAINALDFSSMKKRFNTKTAVNEKEALEYLVKDLYDTISHSTKSLEDLKKSIELCTTKRERDVLMSQKKDLDEALEKAEHKLSCIKERIIENSMCLICYDDVVVKSITSCCKNTYCIKCITMWLDMKHKCPYCRSVDFEIITIGEGESGPEKVSEKPQEKIEEKTKIDTLKELFENKLGSKVIIFSDYRKIFMQVADMLDGIGVAHVELDGGNISAIDRDIAAYKEGGSRVLMTNSSLYGCGMNLENTTDIVLMHRTQDKMYEQVVGRAQRPGRAGPLRIWRLFHENEHLI
jgi:hypothetical protein